MARATPVCNICYKLDFEAAIHGHHIYQLKWTPELNLKLKCAIDTKDEAVEHGEEAIGVYLCGKEGLLDTFPLRYQNSWSSFSM